MSNKNSVKKITVFPNAKINIGLRVLGRRNDGFHDLETIFYPVKLHDRITLSITKINKDEHVIAVRSNPGLGIAGKKNICFKAAEEFLKRFGPDIHHKYRININIKKNIPSGAGLGGGSSDAASVILVLLKYFKLRKSPQEIIHLAMDIGSDVPFFMLGKPAYAAGRGEKLTPLPGFRIRGKILLVNPGIHISTPWAFKELGIKNRRRTILKTSAKFDPNDPKLMINDFERVVFKKFPEIEKIKMDMLRLGASFSLMSGSGSTIYGVFSSSKIKAARSFFKIQGYKVFEG
jgi:4-diphosphocytidyl-2-C-methyl-D-erythritol kinase